MLTDNTFVRELVIKKHKEAIKLKEDVYDALSDARVNFKRAQENLKLAEDLYNKVSLQLKCFEEAFIDFLHED